MDQEDGVLKFLKDKKQELGGSLPLAQKIGVSDRTIDAWLSGTRHPSRKNIQSIAECFFHSVRYLRDYGMPPGAHRSTWGDQKALAKAAGVDPSFISMIMSGKRQPSFEVAEKIADYQGVHVAHVMAPDRYDEDGRKRPAAARTTTTDDGWVWVTEPMS